MQSFLMTLITCSVTMSMLVLFYIAITPLFAKRYSEKACYYAWLIIVIGLIIPFRPQFDNPIIKLDMPIEMTTPIIQAGNIASLDISDITIVSSPAVPSTSWQQAAVLVWILGIIAFLAYHIIKHYCFMKMARRWSNVITDEQTLTLFQSLKAEMGIPKKINLYICTSVRSPMMIGLLKPKILLPNYDLTHEELRFILKHELVHFKRKDLTYKYLVLVATAIHWFNPIIHLMAKAISAGCELSCDAEVVLNTDEDTRLHYSETIIGLIRYQSKLKTALSTNFYGSKQGIKNRIASIMETGKKKAGISIICYILIATAGTSFAFAANVDDSASTSNLTNIQMINSSDISALSDFENINFLDDQNDFSESDCSEHKFATFARNIYGYSTSEHNVTYRGRTTPCTIITTIYILENVCENCGYSSGTYKGGSDTHSVPHHLRR